MDLSGVVSSNTSVSSSLDTSSLNIGGQIGNSQLGVVADVEDTTIDVSGSVNNSGLGISGSVSLTASSGAVTSVNGKTGVVVLDAEDVGAYEKPTNGIPKTDLASDVQTSLGKADTALQEHQSLADYRTASAQAVIDATKVDKVSGKGLSTNDYTNTDKAKVDAITTDIASAINTHNVSNSAHAELFNAKTENFKAIFTMVSREMSCDKTVAEIYTAYSGGKARVYCTSQGFTESGFVGIDDIEFPLVKASITSVVFGGICNITSGGSSGAGWYYCYYDYDANGIELNATYIPDIDVLVEKTKIKQTITGTGVSYEIPSTACVYNLITQTGGFTAGTGIDLTDKVITCKYGTSNGSGGYYKLPLEGLDIANGITNTGTDANKPVKSSDVYNALDLKENIGLRFTSSMPWSGADDITHTTSLAVKNYVDDKVKFKKLDNLTYLQVTSALSDDMIPYYVDTTNNRVYIYSHKGTFTPTGESTAYPAYFLTCTVATNTGATIFSKVCMQVSTRTYYYADISQSPSGVTLIDYSNTAESICNTTATAVYSNSFPLLNDVTDKIPFAGINHTYSPSTGINTTSYIFRLEDVTAVKIYKISAVLNTSTLEETYNKTTYTYALTTDAVSISEDQDINSTKTFVNTIGSTLIYGNTSTVNGVCVTTTDGNTATTYTDGEIQHRAYTLLLPLISGTLALTSQIPDAYTKTETDTLLSAKATNSDIQAINTMLNGAGYLKTRISNWLTDKGVTIPTGANLLTVLALAVNELIDIGGAEYSVSGENLEVVNTEASVTNEVFDLADSSASVTGEILTVGV